MASTTAYDTLIATIPSIERKGKTTPYTSLNGHMFSFLDKEGNMGLRLSKEDREEFMKTFQSGPMIQHGRIMKEYVIVLHDMIEDTTSLKPYLEKSVAYVSGLKPKPSKKKKTS